MSGYLEPTNQWYAIAKIAGLKLCEAYRRQYGLDFISAMPTNIYGENDNFNLQNSHVIPALIHKTHLAKINKQRTLTVWGSGQAQREFLHVDDLADACLFIMEKYSDNEAINVGFGSEIKIIDLAELICKVVGFKGKIIFDDSMPDGTPRKILNSSKLFNMGWKPKIDLENGIERTYDWFLKHYNSIRK